MPETTPLIKAALNLRVGAGFDVYFESRLANIYFGKTSKSQNVKNATRLILEEFEKLYQTQYHLCLKR